MLIGIKTHEIEEVLDADIANLCQLKDYLSNTNPTIWNAIKDNKLVYGVGCKDSRLKEQILYPTMLKTDISEYDFLLIVEKLEGEALFTSLALIVAAGITGAGIAAGSTLVLAAYIATFLTTITVIGVIYGIGQLIQMLMPNQKMPNDPSSGQKNLMFNGIPNIKEQGGSIPLIFGECLFGGVQVGVRLATVDYTVGKDVVFDELPKYTTVNDIAYVHSTWARLL